MLVSQIAEILSLEFRGEDREISALNSLQNAKSNELSFVEQKKYLKELESTNAGAIFITEEFAKSAPKSATCIIAKKPHLSLAKISKHFSKPLIAKEGKAPDIALECEIMDNVYIGVDTKIGEGTIIMHGAYIGDRVEIGKNSIIYPNVTLYNDTKIGDRCFVHAGAVIGGDGFGYVHDEQGHHHKIYHSGNVILEDDVEIGANTTVDRAVFASTIVKSGSKIDNLVMIAHNCEIGENSILVSQVGLSGSTITGRNVVFGGQAGTGGHLKIGDFATIAARGGVNSDIEGGKTYAGFPLLEHREWLRLQAKMFKLVKNKT